MSPSDRPDAPVLDLGEALKRMDGDADMLRELARIYLDESPRWVSEAEDAIAGREPAALARAAHDIKGSVGVFAAAPATRVAQELERRGREGALEGAEGVLTELKVELARLREALEAYLKDG